MKPKWRILASTWDSICQLKATDVRDKFNRARRPENLLFVIGAVGDLTVEKVPVVHGAIAVGRHQREQYTLEVIEVSTNCEDPIECSQFLFEAAWTAAQALGFLRLLVPKRIAFKEAAFELPMTMTPPPLGLPAGGNYIDV